tara:strand:+ start:1386 stop:2030 length:645 start_codon:yes stop_codon:yes gene_type:complete
MNFEYFSKLTKTPTIDAIPGCQSHEEFVRPYRDLLKTSRKTYTSSAVMILIYNFEGTAVIPCIKRSKRPGDKHSGQIGLPGGRKDLSDKDLWDTAVRECQEEVGLNHNPQYITQLSPVRIPVSGYEIHPYVALSQQTVPWKIDSNEVETLRFIDVKNLLNAPIQQCPVEVQYLSHAIEVPAFSIDDMVIWGATAMILAEFRDWIVLQKQTVGAA